MNLNSAAGRTVYLVSCVGQKAGNPAPARLMYQSPWFRKVRTLVEQTGSPWFILSAAHGLLHPDAVIAPYEQTLNILSVTERRSWARRVIAQMQAQLPGADRIVVFAGARYREHLMDWLHSRAKTVEIPLAHMRIGEQLAYLGSAGDGSRPDGCQPWKKPPQRPGSRDLVTGGGRGSIYDPLRDYLCSRPGGSVELSFDQIESILKRRLPVSAARYPAWWANSRSHSQARAWLDAGWRVDACSLSGKSVRFCRVG